MELEHAPHSEDLSNLSDASLEVRLNSGLEELNRRIFQEIDPASKNCKIANLGIYYAKVFSVLHKAMGNRSQPLTCTPFRANLLSISDMLTAEEEQDPAIISSFIHEFWTKCKCHRYCFSRVPVREAFNIYKQYSRMKKKEKANKIGAVLTNLLSNKRDESKNSFQYSVAGEILCKDFFIFIYHTTRGVLERLQSCIKDNKPFEQNWGGNNRVEKERIEELRIFLTNSLVEWALPSPNSTGPEYFLPANFEWKATYKKFCERHKEVYGDDDSPLSWGRFHKFYTEEFDTFKKLAKKTDYCDSCCRLKTLLRNPNIDPIEKDSTMAALDDHLQLAKIARLAYSDHRIMTAKEDKKVVLSFDYSENILLPILNETPSQFYFKRRRKVELFGITNECNNCQLNFIVDECHSIGKGPNSVISMLDYYLNNFVEPLSSLTLYSDNAPGQNKNARMVAYLCYLTKILKRYPRIEYYFMLSGHTKFSPDGHFGSIKRKLKNEVCQGITDLLGPIGIIQRSAHNNQAIGYKDPLTNDKNFDWKEWKEFLSSQFFSCPGIREWHVVIIESEGPFILVKENIEAETRQVRILKENAIFLNEPNIIQPKGLTATRVTELQYFSDYVDEGYKSWITSA